MWICYCDILLVLDSFRAIILRVYFGISKIATKTDKKTTKATTTTTILIRMIMLLMQDYMENVKGKEINLLRTTVKIPGQRPKGETRLHGWNN